MNTMVDALRELMQRRILVLDGAMGTMLQAERLDERAWRGERLKGHDSDLRGDSDILSLTRPDIVRKIHDAYLDAGADIIETNTFTATSIAQADYRLEPLVYEMNVASARIAKEAAAAAFERSPGQRRFVAGAVGPTNRTLSISPQASRACAGCNS